MGRRRCDLLAGTGTAHHPAGPPQRGTDHRQPCRDPAAVAFHTHHIGHRRSRTRTVRLVSPGRPHPAQQPGFSGGGGRTAVHQLESAGRPAAPSGATHPLGGRFHRGTSRTRPSASTDSRGDSCPSADAVGLGATQRSGHRTTPSPPCRQPGGGTAHHVHRSGAPTSPGPCGVGDGYVPVVVGHRAPSGGVAPHRHPAGPRRSASHGDHRHGRSARCGPTGR